MRLTSAAHLTQRSLASSEAVGAALFHLLGFPAQGLLGVLGCLGQFALRLVAEATAAVTEYGGAFTAVVERENVMGVQFHPEKSSAVGLQVLRNFVEL